MRPIHTTTTLLYFLVVKICTADPSSYTIFNLSGFRIDYFDQLGKIWNGSCSNVGITVRMSPQVVTNSYMNSVTLETQYALSTVYSIQFNNPASFRVPNPSDTYIIGAAIDMTCQGLKTSDYVVLMYLSNNTWDGSSQGYVNGVSVSWGLNVTAYQTRLCDPIDKFGFNCVTRCDNEYDGVSCYECEPDGTKRCCHDSNVDQNTCYYKNITVLTTSTYNPFNPNNGGSSKSDNETLYFWFMIGLAVLAFILIILVLILIIVMCTRSNEKKVIQPVYMEQQRPLPPYQDRRDTYRNYTGSRRSASIPRARVHDSREERDDSFRDEWVEPQPRRVAKV